MQPAPHTAEPAYVPAPDPDRALDCPLRLLNLVQTLIAFGKQLADTIRAFSSAEAPLDTAMRFGTKDIARILARITRGLAIAAALETKLADRAAHPLPARAPRTPSKRAPRAPTRSPRADESVSTLVTLPTAQEIADQLRRRPTHLVLLDICSDLGILPSDPMYRELFHVFTGHGKSLDAFYRDTKRRIRITNFFPPEAPMILPALPHMPQPHLATAMASTGPP